MTDLELRAGIAHTGGVAHAFTTWEYPYFRDDVDNWLPRLRQLQGLGAQYVSSYIPWRHHEPVDGTGRLRYDFTGHSRPNRDLIRFIELCRELGLSLVLKPGPFCHAELNYGGLPDRLQPHDGGLTAVVDSTGAPVTWPGSLSNPDGSRQQWSLPSPHDPRFLAEVDAWLTAVREQVLLPACAGPLVAVQIGNEGIYSDAQHAVWASDYSVHAIAGYQTWLADRYGYDLTACARAHGRPYRSWAEVTPPRRDEPVTAAHTARHTDWSGWHGAAMGELYTRWRTTLNLPVETFANVNPPRGDDWGIDAWLSRVEPEGWGGVHYGYTNWIGVAASDDSALARYIMLTRIWPGPNIEENWGFSQQYDPRYEHPNVCFQQTLVALAGGATGFNVYTAIGTDAWDEELDRFEPRPYPAHAPINPDGGSWAKTAVVQHLTTYLADHGAELATCRPISGVTWGMIRHAAHWSAWVGSDGITLDGKHWPAQGRQYLDVHAALTRAGIDVDVIELDEYNPDTNTKVLLLAGTPTITRALWKRLHDYGAAGLTIIVVGTPPVLFTDDQQPVPASEILTVVDGPDRLPAHLRGLTQVTSVHSTGDALVWVRRHPVDDITHIVVVTRDQATTTIDVPFPDGLLPVTVRIAPGAGALIRLQGHKVSAALLKGAAEEAGVTVIPSLDVSGTVVTGLEYGDLLHDTCHRDEPLQEVGKPAT